MLKSQLILALAGLVSSQVESGRLVERGCTLECIAGCVEEDSLNDLMDIGAAMPKLGALLFAGCF